MTVSKQSQDGTAAALQLVKGNLVYLDVHCWTCHRKQKFHNLCDFNVSFVGSSGSQLRVPDERSLDKLFRCSTLRRYFSRKGK
jgi:hypothetical protein